VDRLRQVGGIVTALPEPDEAWAIEAIHSAVRLGLVGRPADPHRAGLAPTQLGLMVGAVLEQLAAELVAEVVARGYLADPANEPELRPAVLCARYYDDPRRGGTELLAPTPEDQDR
jgi:hypothetical protein